MQQKLIVLFLVVITLTFSDIDPAVANKFETIGSGVSGSDKIKIESLKSIAFTAGILMFIAGTLAVMFRNTNTHTLNHTMWKPSSIIFFLLGFISIGTGFYL